MTPTKRMNFLTLILGSVISCYVGLINQYPVTYPDTGTYIGTGFDGVVPNDRTIFYGLFIRHMSLSASLWFVVAVQSFITSYLLYQTLGIFIKKEIRNYVFISLVTVLSLTTGFSYNISFLIPDIFSAIVFMCLLNLLYNENLSKSKTIFISAIFIFGIGTHLSNIPILFLILALLFVREGYRKFTKKDPALKFRKLVFSAFLYLASLIIIPAVHYTYENKFQYSQSSHVFIINHMIDTGVLEDYLKANCNNKDYRICEYKDSIGWNFLWRDNSPIYKTGGWVANTKEYNEIIKDIITTPKYFVLLSVKSIEYTFKQLFCFYTDVTPPQSVGSPPYIFIDWHYKDSVREYIMSLQNNSKLEKYIPVVIEQWIILLSMAFLFFVMVSPSISTKLPVELKYATGFVIIYDIVSCFVSANMAMVEPRYQNRIVWLMPVFSVIIILNLLEIKKKGRSLIVTP